MPELRWTLLILGVIFIVVLTWWERRRPHQASRQTPHIGVEPRSTTSDDPAWDTDIEAANPRSPREPTLTLPEIHTRESLAQRDPTPGRDLSAQRDPPVVEIPDDSHIGLRVDGERVEDEVASDEAETEDADEEEAIVPLAPDPPTPAPKPTPTPASDQTAELPPVAAARPIVEWPEEQERKVLALRLVARPPERFSGHLVRQALAAEGFVLGELSIFHKADAANRAVLSIASLTKPGTFDLETMDTQRYAGLNLFAVLPGPRSPQKAFEELLLTARTLNERLEGALQDDRGGPLTPTRIQVIRDGLGAEAKS